MPVTLIETMTLEGHDISPELVTRENTEDNSTETTWEVDEQKVKKGVTFDKVTKRSESILTEVTVDKMTTPPPEKIKFAPSATATEVSMATGVETDKVIQRGISPVEAIAMEIERQLLQPREQFPDQREDQQEEVQSSVFSYCFRYSNTRLIFLIY